ncbi:MAG: ABC transporter ATP-binding protein [Elainellaceae cyanobacterium]
MSDTILEVRDLEIQFQGDTHIIQAVDGISFEVERGQTLGIVGESGSGKSVTALSIMGLVPSPPGRVTGGSINYREQSCEFIDFARLQPEQIQPYRGGKVSMIFQEPMSSLNPVYTCGFQIIEAIRQHEDVSKSAARRHAASLLQEVKLLPSDEEMRHIYVDGWKNRVLGSSSHRASTAPMADDAFPPDGDIDEYVNQQKLAMLDRYPHELSGGQIQRVMIAMAICCNPDLLIADEPTTALDVTVQATILDLLRELRDRRGMSMIFITHDLGIIAEIADSVAVMYRGKIVEYGTILDIFSNPQHPYTKGLLTCRPRLDQRLRCLPTVSDFMDVTVDEAGDTVIKEKISTLTFGESECVSQDELDARLGQLQQQNPLLSVRDMRVGFPIRGFLGRTQRYLMAVNHVSFDIYPGETLGLVGESGCGKSTLASSLLRLIQPLGGEILFDGVDVMNLGSRQLRQLRRDMQIIFQDPFSSLDPRISIGEAVMEPLKIHKVGQSRRQRRMRVAELLERVGLNPNFIDRYPHEFSGGQRQRICIARALALNPKFIICDESVSALDVSVQAQVLNLLKGLQSEFGLTYIFISHDLSVVKFMSDRIMVMNRGKVEEIGPAEDIYRQPSQAYTRQLIAAIPTGSIERIRDRMAQRSA